MNPLRKITINLYDADIRWFERNYGYGWSVHLREMIHRFVKEKTATQEGIDNAD